MNDSLINIGLYLAYILVGIGVAATVIFPIMYMVKNFAEAKKGLMGIAALIIVFVLGYGIASSEIPLALMKSANAFNVDGSSFKMIGAGLNTFFILAGLAIILILVGEVRAFLK